MAKKNALTRAQKNKAAALHRAGQLREAEAAYARVCQIDRADAEAWLARAFLNRRLGRYAEAETCAQAALRLAPQACDGVLELGKCLQAQGCRDEALEHYRRAARLQPQLPEPHYLQANVLREQGSLREAVAAYREAIRLNPDFVEALANMGAVLTALGDTAEAADALNRAILLRPDSPPILCNLANILQRDGRFEQALVRYEVALRHAPDFLDALTGLATLYESTNRIEQAEMLVEQALAFHPESPQLLVVAAKLARRRKEPEKAIALLERALGGMDEAGRGGLFILLGQMYDAIGDAKRAYANLLEGNRLGALVAAEMSAGQETYASRIRRLRMYLSPELADVETGPRGRDDPDAPVFLIGFPRSGTTLLEQILDSHAGLQTLEEKGTVSAMVREFEAMAGGDPTALANLREEQVEALRALYFREVDRYLTRTPGTRLVDKMPLNTVNVHILWRVFPRAKFVLAIRHPCDACFSCFMQNFLINEAMANFFTLKGGAETYDEVMQTWKAAVECLPLDYHRIRYEDLVADFEGETRALLAFLGVGWDESVRGHAEHAMRRGTINTPSYHQVTQPIYQHARYRWKRYREEFSEALPLLEPWIAYFDYAEALTEAR